MLTAGHRAQLLAAVLPCIPLETDTGATDALALVIAVTGTGQLGTVLTSEAFLTDTLSIDALTPVVAISWAFWFRAVGSFPAGFTNAATAVCAVVAPTTTERCCVQSTCNNQKVKLC